jgi:curved DNA-binding protein
MPVQYKDYYEILGVEKSASQEEIRKAFRRLARVHHPDVAKDKKAAEAKFKEINEAYEVLGDPEKRQKYDSLGPNWQQAGGFQPPPGWQGFGEGGQGEEFHFGGTGFSDFFESLFGGMRGRGNPFGGMGREAGGRDFAQQGGDIEADILVTIEEAMKGARRKVSFQRSGNGKVKTYDVRIPAGVAEGQRIRLAGQGRPGGRGGKAGDLYLRIKLAQHPEFRAEGGNLIHEHPLHPWQAVLGCEISVPTPEGRARLKIPPGTQGGQRFRLRQHGLPTGGKSRGDLYVDIQIDIPKTLTPGERALWEQLAR